MKANTLTATITEERNPRSKNLDTIDTGKAIELFIGEEIKGLKSILKEKKSIKKAVIAASETIKSGGRVFYIGAGTSGRLGVLDSAEVPPTFSMPSTKFQAIIAGGKKAVFTSVENAEDNIQSAMKAIRSKKISSKDMVIGITASGKTPFVISALKKAKEQGAKTWLITFNKVQKLPFIDGIINAVTGPEILAGSTRLKAGTATKVILNMISTLSMVRFGKTYQNLMIDVRPSNKKLWTRAKGIIMQVTGIKEDEAEKLLKDARGNAKTAVLMKMKKLNQPQAERLLKKHGGMLRGALK
ncbi:MAG: N-acetylmuramic acid 6-phosphate etherase [Nitrospirae bacterium]|nr:N-acetylmuramic acid 6-phosphate etherase [Nitrospirota bacterium]